MQTSPETDSTAETPAETAQRWIVHFSSGAATEVDKAHLELWLEQSPEHRLAFESEWAFWNQLGQFREKLTQSEALDTSATIVEFPSTRRRGRTMAIAAALAATIAFGVLSANFLWTGLNADYSSPVGERRIVMLADGSKVTLNSGSSIAANISGDQRDIKLLEGEAYFEVKPDHERPFRVFAYDGYAQAVGTAFSVKAKEASVEVVVTEGIVAVSSTSTGGPVLVRHGQRVSYGKPQEPVVPVVVDVEAATAWRTGQLVIEAQSFSDAMTELQRYWPGRIVILRRQGAPRPISLISSTSQIEHQITSLAASHGYSVTKIGDQLLILR